MLLRGKIAIVTGAAGNLGGATARELAAEGAKVVASDLPGEGLERAVESIRKSTSPRSSPAPSRPMAVWICWPVSRR
jgi:NAD(P)-dependent dehydrogenase (short-subunit alcohol dehydrogenase family)